MKFASVLRVGIVKVFPHIIKEHNSLGLGLSVGLGQCKHTIRQLNYQDLILSYDLTISQTFKIKNRDKQFFVLIFT